MKKLVCLTLTCTFALALLAFGSINASAQASFDQQQRSAAMYSCPMHPEVKSKKRGKCPKCKMDLVRQTAVAAAQSPVTSNIVAPPAGTGRHLNIPDVEILDQDGNVRHFYTDLVKGKTIAINFIFTNCTTICPPLAATFARLQRDLGDRAGKDVHLISISVDPLTDTPERLKAWGAKFKAGPGWTFVTGNKPEMDELLRALGASVARREDHTPAVIIGNDAKDVWTRTYGLASPSQMMGVIENLIAGRVEEPLAKETVKP